MNPDVASIEDTVVVAQLTLPNGRWTATLGAQGKSTSGRDWEADGIMFTAPAVGGGGH
eukprot:SAG31_NODE_388_length_16371_cov_5.228982_2_plen_58_part_00